ncbi:MAG: TetR/AcrR family transcriptional regulator [Nitrospinae bacterium]|nr:TetR/AcrR family transcriptional regulator [Nitrospinota bacterium]
MARTREYEREQVLSKAAALFWRKGFDATSMSELVEATGLNSASMYKEFGNKDGLFESALEDYRKKWLEPFIKPLTDEPNMKGIEKFLATAANHAESADFTGCLMMNTLSEKGSVSSGAVQRAEKFCVKLEAVLENAIRGAQREGSVPPKKDPAVLANYIVCFIQGLVLYGRVDDHKPYVALILDTVKAALQK